MALLVLNFLPKSGQGVGLWVAKPISIWRGKLAGGLSRFASWPRYASYSRLVGYSRFASCARFASYSRFTRFSSYPSPTSSCSFIGRRSHLFTLSPFHLYGHLFHLFTLSLFHLSWRLVYDKKRTLRNAKTKKLIFFNIYNVFFRQTIGLLFDVFRNFATRISQLK